MQTRRPQTHSANAGPADYHRQEFCRPQTYIGAGSGGHWIKTAGILSPLIIGELVQDADKRWRWIRISSLITALVSEGFYANRIRQQRERQQEYCR